MNETARSTRSLRLFHPLLAVALAAATLLTNTAMAPEAPPRDLVVELHQLTAEPADVTICTQDQATFTVRAVLTVRRFTSITDVFVDPHGRDTRRPLAGQAIFANVANPSLGQITPTGRMTSMASHPPGANQYTFFSNDQPGHTQVTFSSPPVFDPVSVEVEVKKCKYRIELDSAWDVERGFLPHMYSNWWAEVTPDSNLEFDVLEPVLDQVYWRSAFACPHTVAASVSKARLKGGVTSGQIHFSVDYDPVPGMAEIPCSIGIWQSTGENKDTSMVSDMTLARLDVNLQTGVNQSVRTTRPHELVMPDGTWTGLTTITVTTIPQ